jgi:hypothetical protein
MKLPIKPSTQQSNHNNMLIIDNEDMKRYKPYMKIGTKKGHREIVID